MSIGFNMNIGFQTGSPDMIAYQQRMMMRQNQLGQCYMPVAHPSMEQIMGFQGFYNGCLGNIQQLRYGMPYGQGLFEGLPSANTMAYLDPQVMQYLQMMRQRTSTTIMMCLMYEQQYQMQQAMLRMMMMGQQNQMNSDILRQLFQQQQMQQQQYMNPQTTQYPQTQQIQQTQQPVNTGVARADAVALHNAMEGLGTDEATLSSLLASRTNEQIKAIREEYQNLYGVSLEESVKGDTSGNYQKALLKLMSGSRSNAPANEGEARADAVALRQAMQGMGTNEDVLTNILCSRNREQLEAVKKAYQQMYGRDLSKDVSGETHGMFENNAYGDLLGSVLNNSPSRNPAVK